MTDGPSDAEIEALLLDAPQERWQDLWDSVAALDAEADHGRWAGGERAQTLTIDGVETPVMHLPYVVYGPAVERTIAAVQALGASLPFDWQAWGGLSRYPSGHGLESAPVAESVRMVTAIVRADRFSEGTLLAAVEDGTLLTALRRLRRWCEEHGA